MTANQCHRPNLGTPKIFETYSLCSLRSDAETGNRLHQAALKCCGGSIKGYQCWYYCKVEEALFPTWLGCVQETLNSTWGSACQRADQSPLLTEPAPPPETYTGRPPGSLVARDNTAASTSPATAAATPTGAGNTTGIVHTPTPTPTGAQKNGSPGAMRMSMGGIICALLIFSTISL